MIKNTVRFISLATCISVLITGCTSVGSTLLPSYREGFNVKLLRSEEEQLLLNIVRMQFGDRPYFLGVDSVTTSNSVSYSLSGSWSFTDPATSNNYSLSPSASFSDSPTVSYKPLQGESFTSQMLRPISLERLYLLLRSDWSLARVLRVAVQRLEDLENARGSTRPGSSHIPTKGYKDFIELAHTLRKLETEGRLVMQGEKINGVFVIAVSGRKNYAKTPHLKRLLSLLHIKNWDGTLLLSETNIPQTNPKIPAPNDVVIVTTRSVLSMLYYLSKSVEVSPSQIEQGLVVVPRYPDGKLFTWSEVTDGIFRVHSADFCPTDANVAVYYRGRCFYIADNDTNSKETMALMEQIYSLASGDTTGPAPILTLPVR